jgi:methionyl aminopeptidase
LVSSKNGVTIKSQQEIVSMKKAGRVVAIALKKIADLIMPGITTAYLDAIASEEIRSMGAKPAFLGLYGFPATICASINEEIVHGIPGDRIIKSGDLVKIDIGAIIDGMYSDHAVTFAVGEVTDEAIGLIDSTRNALKIAVEAVAPGVRLGDIGSSIQGYAEGLGYSVVREYVGHGIGRALHEDPAVPNYGIPGRGMVLREGMAIAIEPMLNIGTWKTEVLEDNWTVVTADRKLSAHFEHTMIVTKDGVELTTVL